MEITVVSLYLSSFLLYIAAFFSKNKFFSNCALASLALGFLGNLYLIIRHLFNAHRMPLTNTPETLLSMVAVIVLIFLILEFFTKGGSAFGERAGRFKTIGLFVSLISSLGLIFAFYVLRKPLMPLLPALQSKWLAFHVASCIIAYSFFAISFITAIIFLAKKSSAPDERIWLNRLSHRSICIGFFLLTLGIILGSVWGKSAWGHWWNWDPKETWALVTWLIYGLYIHGRLFSRWPETKLSWVAVFGFLACLFTYLGVNFLLRGLHSYA